MIELGNPLWIVTQITVQTSDRKEWSTFWKILIVFPLNVQSSRQEALLYVFDDNEAVIKMIINGRNTTTRHFSRTRRVALDWFLDKTNLDPKIQIKYIDTKSQLADMPTKGIFSTWRMESFVVLVKH